MQQTILLFAAASLFLSLTVNYFLLKYLRQLGIYNKQRRENLVRWAAQSKPSIGGIGFFAVFLLSFLAICGLGGWLDGAVQTALPATLPALSLTISATIPCFLLCCTIGFLVGLLDDSFVMPPRFKFIGQLLCALIMSLGGVVISISDNAVFNYIFTAVWVIGIMNSINMLDNMDGITAGVSAGIILNILLLSSVFLFPYNFFLVGMFCALLGFLYYNWSPSKIFMGDAGSQLLGIFLAFTSVLFVWNTPYALPHISAKLVLPAIIFMLPVMDTTTVTIHRLLRGQSPAVGGRDHLTHHLAYCGLNDRQVAGVFATLSAITVLLTYYVASVMQAKQWTSTYTIVAALFLLIVFCVFQYFYRIGHQKQAAQSNKK